MCTCVRIKFLSYLSSQANICISHMGQSKHGSDTINVVLIACEWMFVYDSLWLCVMLSVVVC